MRSRSVAFVQPRSLSLKRAGRKATTKMALHMRARGRTTAVAVAVAVLLPGGIAAAEGSAGPAAGPEGAVELVSIRTDGQQLTYDARLPPATPVLSRHGRYVVFQSRDPDVTDVADSNSAEDVFVRDRVAGTDALVSVAHGHAVGAGDGSISADGRYVAFISGSEALTRDDSNGHQDVFVRDLRTGDVRLVSKATDGTQRNVDTAAAVISGNGRRVAFLTFARLSRADDDHAPADEWWKRYDVYMHNLATGRTRLVSVNRNGDNFTGPVGLGGISYDGRLIGFSWGNSGRHPLDVPGGFYVRNLANHGSTLIWRENINALSWDVGAAPMLSGDGRFAAFASESDRIDPEPGFATADIVRMSLRTGQRSLVSVGAGNADADNDSDSPTLSQHGRFVSFSSEASNLSAADDNEVQDAFRFDLGTRRMALVSMAMDGGTGNASSAAGGGVSVSADGLHVAFHSFAGDLTSTDTNSGDVFMWTAHDGR